MKLDPAKDPDTKNWSQCKIQSLIWLLEHITRDIRPKDWRIRECVSTFFLRENFSDVHKCVHSKIIRGNSQGD